MQAATEQGEVGQGLGQLGVDGGEPGHRLGTARLRAGLGHGLGKGLEPAAGPFVQPLLEPLSLLVSRVEQPATRQGELGDPLPDLGLEPSVCRRQRGRRSHVVEQALVVEHGRVVHQRRERTIGALDGCHRVARVRPGQGEGATAGVDPDRLVRHPVGDLETGITQRPCEVDPKPVRGRRTELDHEVGDLSALPPVTEQ